MITKSKTWSAIKAIKSIVNKYPNIEFIVVVPTDNLKEQWEEYINTNNLSYNGNVVVINTAIKNNYITDILIIDECHRANATTFRNIFNTISYKYILGLTATFERLDNLHKEVIEKYCPVIDEITLEEALNNGWISEFKEYQVLIEVDDIDVYKQYNKDFIKHFEFFDFNFDLALSMIGKNGYQNRVKLRDSLCTSGDYNDKKMMLQTITYHATGFMRATQARKAFINNHPKKIEIARKIINSRQSQKIITFSNNIKMAESIGCNGKVYSSKESNKKNRITLDEFKNGDFQVLHSSCKLNEGADLKGLSVAIILGLDSSKIKSVQRRGRVIRKENNKQAEIFNIVIVDTVELKWFSNSHKDSSYITIDEEGLDDVLCGKEPRPYTKQIKNLQFRF